MLVLSPKMKAVMLTIAALLCTLAGAGVHSLCTSCPCKCPECTCPRQAPEPSSSDK